MNNKNFWFIVGSQLLYGEDVLNTVDKRAKEMVDTLNNSNNLPFKLIYSCTVKSSDEILNLFKEANRDDNCLGVISWCHTFSPSKMWINGFSILEKPYCHLATQYNQHIPNDEIDMDFMNLNQAAHGDREHGYISTRMNIKKKTIAGYWKEDRLQKRLGRWMRVAYGAYVSKNLKLMRFGDNMREVAVTEGDKVEAQIKFGWQVNTWPVGKLVEYINSVSETEVQELFDEYKNLYDINTENTESIKYQAKLEIAMKKLMEKENCKAFSNTFQDLYGMKQLPGLATQRLMAQGYGYGGEGDWKTAAMTYIMKEMATGLSGGTSFMEDYTYHFTSENDGYILGAHMLEVCPSLASSKPKIEVHELGIGGKDDPARLVFEGKEGKAIAVSLVNLGGRMRLICQDINCIKPLFDMPNLPVARVMWTAEPNLETSIEAWLLCGGAHHTTISYDLTAEDMRDWANIMDIEFIHISKDTNIEKLQDEIILSNYAWKLRG